MLRLVATPVMRRTLSLERTKSQDLRAVEACVSSAGLLDMGIRLGSAAGSSGSGGSSAERSAGKQRDSSHAVTSRPTLDLARLPSPPELLGSVLPTRDSMPASLSLDVLERMLKLSDSLSGSTDESLLAPTGSAVMPSRALVDGAPPPRSSYAGGINAVVAGVWDSVGGVSASARRGDSLLMQLLRASSCLSAVRPIALMRERRTLIRFAWQHLRHRDTPLKYRAYGLVTRFIATFDTPSKVVLQVFVSLLRDCRPDTSATTRVPVRRALTTIVRSMRRWLSSDELARAVRWVKKILNDESHATPQIVHLWRLIAAHERLFFQFRKQFTTLLVNALPRLGLPQSLSMPHRFLAVDLATVMVIWELRARKQVAQERGQEYLEKLLRDSQTEWADKNQSSSRPASSAL